jgi:hypothetical protein
MVTQRCLSGINICASWHVAQSAEIDATSAGFGAAKSTAVLQIATRAGSAKTATGNFPEPLWDEERVERALNN